MLIILNIIMILTTFKNKNFSKFADKLKKKGSSSTNLIRRSFTNQNESKSKLMFIKKIKKFY
jgi:hypothetical protein